MISPRFLQRGKATALFIGAGTLVALSIWMMFWNLGASSISIASDEVIYVRIVQGILHEGGIFPLVHGKLPSFEKPPLVFWMNAIIPWLVGESNWSFRSLNAGLGVCSLIMSVALARSIFGSMMGALAVGFLLLGVPEWIIAQHGFRRVVLDCLLTVMTLGMALFSWRAIEDSRSGRSATSNLWGVVVLCSLALMTKSVAAFVPLVCSVVSIVAICPRVLSIRRGLMSLIPGVVFSVYIIALWIVGGFKAIETFLGTEILTRTFGGFEGHNTNAPFFYWRYLFVRGAGAPRALLIMGTLGVVIGALKDIRLRYLAVWGFFPVIAYSCAASKTPWYLNPFFPFLCMVAVFGTAYLIQELHRASSNKALQGIVVCVVLAMTLPAYERALSRHLREVAHDTSRLEIDLLVSQLRERFSNFLIVDGCISGHSNPRRGRFNIEGIYREMLKPTLRTVRDVTDVVPTPGQVVFLKEESLKALPLGWRELGRLQPYGSRSWSVVAIEYPTISR